MQPQLPNEQPLSVHRRPLDVEDYIDILRRHRSWILGPAFAGLVLGVVIAYLWPDSYMATGMIRIVPPQVSQRLVETNVSEAMSQRIQAIQQNIISRPTLTNIIQTYNLYPDERKRLPMQDVIETMRNDINVGRLTGVTRVNGRDAGAFAVSFSYSDKRIAQKVTEDIISRFIDESTRTRSTQSVMTTEFFRDQLEASRRELDEIDHKLADFKSKNMGQLPEQEQLIIGRLGMLEQSVQNVNAAMSRVSQDKLQLEANLRTLRDQQTAINQPASEGGSAPPAPRDEKLAEVEREIDRLRSLLATMKENYKDSHPDVQRVQGLLDMKKRERDELAAAAESRKSTDSPAKPARASAGQQRATRQVDAAIAQVQAALQAKDLEREDLERQLKTATQQIHDYQSRLQATPGAQQAYLELMRDREISKNRYQELSQKMQSSSMATDLENRKQGETLEVLEQPIMPAEPYAPKRQLIIIGGLFAGMALGIGLASARELKDSSLKNLKDVRAYTKLTVLGSIPLLENDFVVRRRRRIGWLTWAAAFLFGVLLMTGSVVYYYSSKT